MSRSSSNSHTVLAAIAVSSIVAAAVSCLVAAPAPAAPPSAGRYLAQLGDNLGGARADLNRFLGTTQDQGLDPAQYVPLALNDHYRLPPWSGPARFGFGVDESPVEQYDVSLLSAG